MARTYYLVHAVMDHTEDFTIQLCSDFHKAVALAREFSARRGDVDDEPLTTQEILTKTYHRGRVNHSYYVTPITVDDPRGAWISEDW